MNTCLKLHLPEWTLAWNYTCQNEHLSQITFPRKLICQKLHLPESTFGRNYIPPKTYLPECTFGRNYISPKTYLPEFTLARMYIWPKITFSRKLIFQILSFYSPSCLGQETAKGPFGFRVKLPPAHMSTTHGEISLLIEFTLQKYIIMLVYFQKLLSCA